MAFALRISGKTKNGQEVYIEPSWWNINELRSTYDFKEELDYYLDCYLYVDKKTFLKIKESQDKYRRKGIYEDQLWILENDRTNSELDEFLQKLQEDSQITIWIYEWESGLG
ncbi:hypothetical protein [Salinimicrobium gaetbulicola]|uniref:Uncharacterized protein n=1 Tax=Salinimicrobium gaetbulicola TaxID=999702 RepID=A0ABW3IGU9_9FLAO